MSADFGYDSDTQLGTIGNLVFLDKDISHTFNSGDTPLAGVTVDLIRDSNSNRAWDAGEPIIATATTDSVLGANNTNYLFSAPLGDFLVHVSDTNAVLTDYAKSPLGAANVDNNNQADPYALNLPAGGSRLTADFGYFLVERPEVNVIGNQLWIEATDDGLFRPADGDFGQAGVTMELYRNGEYYRTNTAGSGGRYSFTGLPAGVYTFTITDDFRILAGYSASRNGPNPGQDNNSQALPYQLTLPVGGYNPTADFGFAMSSNSIGNIVFYDDDRSGTQNGSEVGIPGIAVRLYRDSVGVCDQLVATTVTDSAGAYLFRNLPAAHYCVSVPEAPADNPFLTNFLRSAGTNPHEVNLGSTQHYLNADFGYAGRGAISGTVYYDWNQDGAQGINESGIQNVQVCLFADEDRNGVPDQPTPFRCTTTDSQGAFAFSDLLPGSYVLRETDPTGVISLTPNTFQAWLILSQGGGISGNNNFRDLLKVRVGGFIWVDVNGDGVEDPGETTGLDNVPMQITGTDIIGTAVNLTRNTSQGQYLESDLLPGTYTVTALPAFGGYALTTTPAFKTTTLTTSRTEDLTLNFGYAYPTGVMVQAFRAASRQGQVKLNWGILGGEAEGFRVWRADNPQGAGQELLTPAPVTSADGVSFEYADATATAGQTYWYWLEHASGSQWTGPVGVTAKSGAEIKIFIPMSGKR